MDRRTHRGKPCGMSGDNFVIDRELPCIPPGKYEMGFDTWETCALYGGRARKLILWFAVLSPEYMGLRIPRYYNVRELNGKPGKRGRFKVGKKSDFLREFVHVHGMPDRLDRISPARYQGNKYLAKVRTVETGNRNRPIPKELRYSVVDQIIKAA